MEGGISEPKLTTILGLNIDYLMLLSADPPVINEQHGRGEPAKDWKQPESPPGSYHV